MNKIQLARYFSADRTNRYFSLYPGNESKAIYLYQANIAASEALYTSISILEVALRNKINNELIRKYKRTDWYKHPVMRFAWPEINTAIKHLHEEGKPVMPDKVIAGLMFGFMSEVINFL